MIKKFKLLIILLFLTSVNTANSRELGEATEYKMTIHKLELCAAGSTIGAMGENWSCVDSVDVSGGSIGTAIDIGSEAIGVGESAATLGNFGKVKLGVKYTHIITTLSRHIQITGSTASCSTAGDGALTANITSGNNTGNGASQANTTTPVSSKLFVPAMTGQLASIRSVSDVAGSSPQVNGTIIAAHEYFQTIGSIGSYVLKPGQIPTVTMAFGTQQALAAKAEGNCANGGSDAEMQAAAPVATLTLQGQ
jgi:hypothetical protein